MHITASGCLAAPSPAHYCIRLPHGTVNLSQPAKPILKLHPSASRHRHLPENLTHNLFPRHPAELRTC